MHEQSSTSGSGTVWQPPPLATAQPQRASSWSPPPLTPEREVEAAWTIPPVPSSERHNETVAFRLPKIRAWYLAPIGIVLLVFANADKLPGLWAEMFYRKPSEKWAKVIASQEVPALLEKGNAVSLAFTEVTTVRERAGEAVVTVRGVATAREELFESVSTEKAIADMPGKLQALQKANDRARTVQERGGSTVRGFDGGDQVLIRPVAAAGATAPFESEFTAHREGTTWKLQAMQRVHFIPADALPGRAASAFGESVVVLGTDAGTRALVELGREVDAYASRAGEAERALLQRFAAEGKDEWGKPVFPSRSLPGERYVETRQRYFEPQELDGWSEENLQYAINEMFARRGAEFGNKKVAEWFRQFSWYNPRPGSSFEEIEASMSEIEVHNVKTLGYARTAAKQAVVEQRRAAAAQAKRNAVMAQQQREAIRRQREREMGEAFLRAILGGVEAGLRRHR
jgi:hypothetical protein